VRIRQYVILLLTRPPHTARTQVLKPGGKFASYEWLKTPMYNPADPAHVRVVDGVAEGNALPDVRDLADVLAAAKEAGFEVVNCVDAALGADIPWHAAMKSARVGSYVTHVITAVLEFVGWAPAGTSAVHKMLMCVCAARYALRLRAASQLLPAA
jgi:24-methylenesterol C-methyltransferase